MRWTNTITEKVAARILSVIDYGLNGGTIGERGVLGGMCVQSAVNYAMNEEHNDKPKCVDPYLTQMGIGFNDDCAWRSVESRARGLRKFAIAQLGTRGEFDTQLFMDKFRSKATEIGIQRADEITNPWSLAEGLIHYTIENGPKDEDGDLDWDCAEESLVKVIDIVTDILVEMETEGSKYVCLTKVPKEQLKKIDDAFNAEIERKHAEWLKQNSFTAF